MYIVGKGSPTYWIQFSAFFWLLEFVFFFFFFLVNSFIAVKLNDLHLIQLQSNL